MDRALKAVKNIWLPEMEESGGSLKESNQSKGVATRDRSTWKQFIDTTTSTTSTDKPSPSMTSKHVKAMHTPKTVSPNQTSNTAEAVLLTLLRSQSGQQPTPADNTCCYPELESSLQSAANPLIQLSEWVASLESPRKGQAYGIKRKHMIRMILITWVGRSRMWSHRNQSFH